MDRSVYVRNFESHVKIACQECTVDNCQSCAEFCFARAAVAKDWVSAEKFPGEVGVIHRRPNYCLWRVNLMLALSCTNLSRRKGPANVPKSMASIDFTRILCIILLLCSVLRAIQREYSVLSV